ncbi:unnamed protein product [Meloidogyne enterolobii]|uniref:Uncharacterized protein n=1 Tax=Meloidogyne enterolobii TaxID=390850 RepID=A0ACB1ANS8_MELEN
MSRRTSTTTPNSQDGEPQARRQRMDIVNNDNNSVGLDIEGIIAAERARATAVAVPAAALQIPNLDPRTFYTSSRVTYSHRGPTMRRAFDRADLLLEVGSTNDLQSIGIYGYDGCAQILEPARQNDIVRLSMLTIVEQTGARNNWTGSLPYVLRFSRSSTMQIIGNAMPATPREDANGNNSGIISNNNNFGITANNNMGTPMSNMSESGGAGLPVIGSSSARGNQMVMNDVSGNPGTSGSSRGGRAIRNANLSGGSRGSSQGVDLFFLKNL